MSAYRVGPAVPPELQTGHCQCPNCACEMPATDAGPCMFCASGMHASSSNLPALERFEVLDMVGSVIDYCAECGFPRPTYAVKMPGSVLFKPVCIVCKLKREADVNAPDRDERTPCEYCRRSVDGSADQYIYQDRAMRLVRMCPIEQDRLVPVWLGPHTDRQCHRCGDQETDIYFDADAIFPLGFPAGEFKFVCHTCIVIDHLRDQIHAQMAAKGALND